MNDGMAEALRLLSLGVLSIDGEGRIWRLKNMSAGRWRDIAPRRAENVGRKRYLRVTMGVGNHRTVMVSAHRLVWTVTHGPIPDGMQINHIDRDPQNNRPSNLELVTCRENIRHAIETGTPEAWSKATTWRGRPRLTEAQIAEIRRRREGGESLRSLAAAFERDQGYISRLCREARRDPRGALRRVRSGEPASAGGLRLAAPRGEQRARAALLLFLVAVGLGVNALASTIRGRESCSDTGCPAGQVCYGRCKPLQVPKPQEPLPLPVAPICGTLLPGRMP